MLLANIYQEDLDGFLALAEELQLKGLAGTKSETFDQKEAKTNPKQTIRMAKEDLDAKKCL